jgi:hypothetical protein
VPVVSEDPKPYYPYPAIYCTSEDSSWSDISTTTPYQERNIFETHCPEGAYIEKAGSGVFIITYLPGLKSPIRAYKTPRNNSRRYSNNPNYQASLNKPYYHRVLTEAEQKAFEEEAPKVIQAYTKSKKKRTYDKARIAFEALALLAQGNPTSPSSSSNCIEDSNQDSNFSGTTKSSSSKSSTQSYKTAEYDTDES